MFHCESETTLFGLPKEDTTINQWLSCIYNSVPEQFNPNIQMCAAHFMEDEDCFSDHKCRHGFMFRGAIRNTTRKKTV